MGLCRPYWTLEAIFVCVVEFTRIQQGKKKLRRGVKHSVTDILKSFLSYHQNEVFQLPVRDNSKIQFSKSKKNPSVKCLTHFQTIGLDKHKIRGKFVNSHNILFHKFLWGRISQLEDDILVKASRCPFSFGEILKSETVRKSNLSPPFRKQRQNFLKQWGC